MKLLPTVRIVIASMFATGSLHSVDAIVGFRATNDGEPHPYEHVYKMLRNAYTAANGIVAITMRSASRPINRASALQGFLRDPPPVDVPLKKKIGKNQGTSTPTSAPTSKGPVRPSLSLRVVTGMENITHVANGLNATTAVGNLIYVRGDVYTDDTIRVDDNKTVVGPIPTPNPYDYFEQVCAIASQHSFPLQPNVTTASCDYTIGGIGSDGQPIQFLLKSGGPYPGMQSPNKELLFLGHHATTVIFNVIGLEHDHIPESKIVFQLDFYVSSDNTKPTPMGVAAFSF